MARCEMRGSGPAGPRRHYEYFRPASLAQALSLGAERPEARLLAGGTDLMVRLHAGTIRPPALISLRAIGDLRGITVDETGAHIGATTTIAELCEHAELVAAYPVLAAAARRMGSPQIRNTATVGGNLCNASPCADMAPPLLVLGAALRILGRTGARELPLDRFFLGPGISALAPGEILADIHLPPPEPRTESVFFKKGRVHMDLALVSLAVLLVLDGDRCRTARVAAGAVAPVPLRLAGVEALLEGQPLHARLIDSAVGAARDAISPVSDVRASADYRRHLIGVYLRRALGRAAAAPPASQGGA